MLYKLWMVSFEGSDYYYSGIELGHIFFKTQKTTFKTDFRPLTQQSCTTSVTSLSNLV